ncbi:MAG TPA: arabinofuranosyltransferase [Mycobacteriales bacterium]|nr:arabinofuranosyltransferase [Mycobacteriales bacterium]
MSNATETRSAQEVAATRGRSLNEGSQAMLVLGLSFVLSCLTLFVTRRAAGDPFGAAAQLAPLAVGLVIALGIALLAVFVNRGVAGVAGAVAVPVWICFFCAWQLAGTPYPYGGVRDDIGRLTAFATRFTVSTGSADQFVRGLPSDYPPLFPWLVGKSAVLTGIPAWRLIGAAEIVFTALAVTAAFVLWRRLFPPLLALAISIVPLAVQGDPRKAYEVMALCILTPWVLLTFGRWPDRPRLHWLPAGVVGGLMVSMYNGYLVYAAMGIVAIVIMGLRGDGRAAYLRHLVLVVAVAAVVASWYLVPWFVDTVRYGSTNMWVHFWPKYVRDNLWYLPWSHGPWISPLIIGGLVLLVYYCRRHAWARYQLAIVVSVMAYRWIWVIIHHYTGNSGVSVHTDRASDAVTLVGLVCGLWQLWQDYVARRTDDQETPRRSLSPLLRAGAVPAGFAVVVGIVLGVFWQNQRVGVPGFAQLAQATPLQGGGRAPYAYHVHFSPRSGWRDPAPLFLPSRQVRRDVESVLGRNALPVALSYSEQISAYAPFNLYLGVGGFSANALSHWPDRAQELRRLAAIKSPAAFAAATAHTKYGPIDVFILRAVGHNRVAWRFVSFTREQFSPRFFASFEEPNHTAVFVRLGAKVEHHSYPR